MKKTVLTLVIVEDSEKEKLSHYTWRVDRSDDNAYLQSVYQKQLELEEDCFKGDSIEKGEYVSVGLRGILEEVVKDVDEQMKGYKLYNPEDNTVGLL